MSADWSAFKSFFNDFGQTVYYVDSEGSEIPIESECEFQEAIRLAKLNKNRLKLVAYSDQSKAESKLVKNQCKNADLIPTDVSLESVKQEAMKEDSVAKGKCQCQCNGDVPPEWFTQYMKKFKKELLQELKSSLGFPIVIEKKLSDPKKEVIDLSCGKIEDTSDVVTSQSKKKKKGLEIDIVDYWEMKMGRKNDKLHSTKFERLEKLDNKTKVLLEERRRLLEKKRHLKQRFEKCGRTMELEILKRSAAFHKREVCIFLPPGSDFVMTLNYSNDGTLNWRDPWLDCYDCNGLYPRPYKIPLPRLQPMESGSTTLRGKVSLYRGTHYFKCRIFDCMKKISPEFTCWAKVENEPEEATSNVMSSCKESHKKKVEDSVGVLIDFEKDEFTATQKKIEENISEIERRLQDISVLRPATPSGDVGNNGVNANISGGSGSNGCDSLQNAGGKEINWKEKLEQEGVYFGVDCLHLATPNNNIQNQENEDGKVENSEKSQKNGESESNSDSELSVIFLSEEDENFVVIPVLPNNPTCAESKNEDIKNVRTPSVGTSNALDAKSVSLGQEPKESTKIEILENNREVFNTNERRQRQPGPFRRLPLGEISKSKPKKIKPSSTEYRFTTANLTQPTFIQITERFSEKRPSKFTFTGDKNEEKSPPENLRGGKTQTQTSTEDRARGRHYAEGVLTSTKHLASGDRYYGEGVFTSTKHPASGDRSYGEGVFTSTKHPASGDRSYGEGVFTSTKHPASGDRYYREGVFTSTKHPASGDRNDIKYTPKRESFDRQPKSTLTRREEDHAQKKDDFRNYTIPTIDDSRKIIYAVNSNGHCFPVGELLKDWNYWRVPRDTPNGSSTRRDSENLHRSEKKYDHCNEVPAVNDLPSALVNGATNVASLAFNTAKSVINNLHSAFTTEGKAEMGKPAYGKRKKVSTNAMITLIEMGFENIELNQKLLRAYENDVMRVVEELIQKTQQGDIF